MKQLHLWRVKMTDGEMIIKLHDLARATDNQQLRQIADRLAELTKKD